MAVRRRSTRLGKKSASRRPARRVRGREGNHAMTSPDGLYTVEEMQASGPFCPVRNVETIPLRNGTCAFCVTLIAEKREYEEERERVSERNRVYQLGHKDQINKHKRELYREKKGHVRRYRIVSDAPPADSRSDASQVMPSGEVEEGAADIR